SNIYLTPFDHAMTNAGYRLTRWADDFVIVCRTRQEAEAALATARAFLHERLGVSLHPGKTRIVHITNGIGVLGYKIRKGKGPKAAGRQAHSSTQPMESFRGPKEKIGGQVQGSNPQPDPPKCSGPAPRCDRGDQPGYTRLGELLPEGARTKTVPSDGWLD